MGAFDFFFKNAGLHKLGNAHAYNEEFSTEMYDKVYNMENMPTFNSYHESGVEIEQEAGAAKLVYEGILAKNGAREVYAVIGYGDNSRWEDIETLKMHKTRGKKFDLDLIVRREGDINIAFKDSAENWDNNSGNNYTFNNHYYQGRH